MRAFLAETAAGIVDRNRNNKERVRVIIAMMIRVIATVKITDKRTGGTSNVQLTW